MSRRSGHRPRSFSEELRARAPWVICSDAAIPVSDHRVSEVLQEVSERCSNEHNVVRLNLNVRGLDLLARHWDRHAWGGENLWDEDIMVSRLPHAILAPSALQDALEAALRGARARS